MSKPLILPRIIMPDPLGRPHSYPTMEGDSPLAVRHNELQCRSWLDTGTYYDSTDLLLRILAEDYNERHSEESTMPQDQPYERFFNR
jgi:hypothetical protein